MFMGKTVFYSLFACVDVYIYIHTHKYKRLWTRHVSQNVYGVYIHIYTTINDVKSQETGVSLLITN